MIEDTMNRAQRRAFDRSAHRTQFGKQRNRPERPKQIPMLAKMQYVLSPLELIIDDIERKGTINTGPGGIPIFQPMGEKSWAATVPAILGISELFEMWASRRGRTLDLTGLNQFAHKLEYGMPIMQSDIDAARSVMGMLRRLIVGLDHEEAKQLLLQVQIKDELETRKSQKSEQEQTA